MPNDTASSESGPSSLQMPSPGKILPLLTESVAHRAELATIELDEARTHAFGSALLAWVTGLSLLLAGFAFTFVVASLVWESPNREWWLLGLCVGYLGVAGATGWILRYRLRTWRPFEETQAQIQLDYQCLNKILKSMTR